MKTENEVNATRLMGLATRTVFLAVAGFSSKEHDKTKNIGQFSHQLSKF